MLLAIFQFWEHLKLHSLCGCSFMLLHCPLKLRSLRRMSRRSWVWDSTLSSATIFMKTLCDISSNWKQKMEFYRNWGWTEDGVLLAYRIADRVPCLWSLSRIFPCQDWIALFLFFTKNNWIALRIYIADWTQFPIN